MFRVTFVAAIFALSIPTAAAGQQQSGQPFGFREGQSVYVAGFHKIEHTKDRNISPVAALNIDSHLPIEQRVRNEFAKWRRYRLVDKIDQADFVFLMYLDGSAAEGQALAPEAYRRQLGQFELETLRSVAYARYVIGAYGIPTLGRMSANLVKTFHDGTSGATGRSSAM